MLVPTVHRFALPLSLNLQPYLTRSHGPRGNAHGDAPASDRRGIRVSLIEPPQSVRKARSHGVHGDEKEPGPPDFRVMPCGRRWNTAFKALLGREEREWALAVRRGSVAHGISTGTVGTRKTGGRCVRICGECIAVHRGNAVRGVLRPRSLVEGRGGRTARSVGGAAFSNRAWECGILCPARGKTAVIGRIHS